jgi:hypothetical protein
VAGSRRGAAYNLLAHMEGGRGGGAALFPLLSNSRHAERAGPPHLACSLTARRRGLSPSAQPYFCEIGTTFRLKVTSSVKP